MAPIASSGNRVEMTLGASASTKMTLSADKGFPNPQLLTQSPEIVNWSGEGTESSENVVELSIEGSDKIDLPIWVKNMRRRTIDITVHPIALLKDDGTIDAPNFIPTQQQLDLFINRVFEEQMNVRCSITLLPIRNIAWDIADGRKAGASAHYQFPMFQQFSSDPNSSIPPPSTISVPGDEKFDVRSANRSPEQAAVIAATNGNAAHVHVYLIGGNSGMRLLRFTTAAESDQLALTVGESLGGFADVDNEPAICWVDAERRNGGDNATKEAVLWTIAHEIGHHYLGSGHPDEETGKAPLQGSDLSHRLMLSGASPLRRSPPGVQLVKAEWDEADIRVEEVGEFRIPPN